MTADQPSGRLAGRIALITGASRGIGAAVAKRFAAEGAHVILGARTQGGLEEVDDAIQAAGGTATLVPLDLRDGNQIDRLGAAIFERFKKLDVLVGNAAELGTLTPVHHIDPKEWDKLVAINLTANYRLIRSLDPLLRQSDAGRAIFVSSGTTTGARAYWSTYAVTKMALEHMVQMYAAELAKTNVRANVIDPGATRTRMRASAYPGEDPANLKTAEDLAPHFVDLAVTDWDKNGEVVRIG